MNTGSLHARRFRRKHVSVFTLRQMNEKWLYGPEKFPGPRNGHLGAVSRKPRKLFKPVKPLQNLEPCDYRAVLFTYSKDREKFPSYKKFQAYTLLRF